MASSDPSPFAAEQVIAYRLRGAPWPAMPLSGRAACVCLVKLKTSSPQTGATFIGQRIRVDRRMPERSRSFASRAVEHGTCVPRAIGAESRNLCGLAVIESRRHRAPNNRHANENPFRLVSQARLRLAAHAKPVANHGPAVPVQAPNKVVRFRKRHRGNSQGHSVPSFTVPSNPGFERTCLRQAAQAPR